MRIKSSLRWGLFKENRWELYDQTQQGNPEWIPLLKIISLERKANSGAVFLKLLPLNTFVATLSRNTEFRAAFAAACD